MKGTFKHWDNSLRPADHMTVDLLKKFDNGTTFVVDLKKQRNPQFHRRAFALLRVLYDMVETELEFDPWRKMLTVKAGYFTSIGKVDIKGTTSVAVTADSLAFESMEDQEFRECWKALHRAFNDKYGNRLTYDELMEWAEM